jgi:hypothetical protein
LEILPQLRQGPPQTTLTQPQLPIQHRPQQGTMQTTPVQPQLPVHHQSSVQSGPTLMRTHDVTVREAPRSSPPASLRNPLGYSTGMTKKEVVVQSSSSSSRSSMAGRCTRASGEPRLGQLDSWESKAPKRKPIAKEDSDSEFDRPVVPKRRLNRSNARALSIGDENYTPIVPASAAVPVAPGLRAAADIQKDINKLLRDMCQCAC